MTYRAITTGEELMNFVAVKHPKDNRSFIFELPMNTTVLAGQWVVVDTKMRDNEIAICVTPSFTGVPDVICPLWGTTKRQMKRVKKLLRESTLKYEDDEEREEAKPFD